MIIKGKSRAGASGLAAHLGNAEKNERVQLLETKNTIATDLRGALVEMEAYAAGTRCQKSLYHAAMSPEPPHRLTPEQRLEAVDALEAKMGLTGHARAVVLHEKEGREHLHVVWSRIDIKTMKSVSDSHNYRRHEEVARDLERSFGHERVQGAHHEREGVERPDRTPSRAELRQEERTGITGKQVKADVTAAFQASDGPEAFRTALEDAGYLLAKGDKRDFVVLDQAGGVHSLARRLDGVKAAELREYMSPIDRESLPTAEEAKEIQLARAKEIADWRAQSSAPDQSRDPAEVTEQEKRQRAVEAQIERERRADIAAKRKARAEDRLEGAYGRGDGYVIQSQTAQAHFERRQKELDKEAKRDTLWTRVEAGDAERAGKVPSDIVLRPIRPDPIDVQREIAIEQAEAEDRERQRRDQEAKSRDTDPGPATEPSSSSSLDNVEITDRMARLLGEFDDDPEQSLSDEDSLDRQREAPGGGRTRSR